MKRIIKAYQDLIGIIWKEAPLMVIATFLCTVISGLLTPLKIYVNQNVFDGGWQWRMAGWHFPITSSFWSCL